VILFAWLDSAGLLQEGDELLFQQVEVPSFTFPHNHYTPAILPQSLLVSKISFNIGPTLCLPKFGISRRSYVTVLAIMHVKEAAIYIDNFLMPYKYDVRFAGKIALMEAITIA
jgi:hypothetical protein